MTKQEKREIKAHKRNIKACKRNARRLERKARITRLSLRNGLEAKLRAIAREQKPTKCFLKLDNAALIFPASENVDISNMFRLSVTMREPVDPVALQYAVNDVIPRFPALASSLKKGAFWYYLEPSYKPVVVSEQRDFPCRKLGSDGRNALFRVMYHEREISVEIFHPATDGTGGVTFINTLVKAYLERTGKKITGRENTLNVLDRPRPEELEDSYQRICDGVTQKKHVDEPAYRVQGEELPATMLLLTTGVASGRQASEIARSRGVTVGQMLTACLIWAVERERELRMDPSEKPVVIALPVNLRSIFPSSSMRNFVGQIPVKGKIGASYEEIEASVKEQMEELITPEYFVGFTNYNIKLQKNKLFRVIPRWIKTLAMKIVLKTMSNRVTTLSFSNLGRIKTPEEFREHVVRYDFVLSPHQRTKLFASAVCFDDVLTVNLGREIRENNVSRFFFRKLAELGLDVTVESNYEVEE